MGNAISRLSAFQAEHNANTKRPLSPMVRLTRMVRDKAFPLDSIEDTETDPSLKIEFEAK